MTINSHRALLHLFRLRLLKSILPYEHCPFGKSPLPHRCAVAL